MLWNIFLLKTGLNITILTTNVNLKMSKFQVGVYRWVLSRGEYLSNFATRKLPFCLKVQRVFFQCIFSLSHNEGCVERHCWFKLHSKDTPNTYLHIDANGIELLHNNGQLGKISVVGIFWDKNSARYVLFLV